MSAPIRLLLVGVVSWIECTRLCERSVEQVFQFGVELAVEFVVDGGYRVARVVSVVGVLFSGYQVPDCCRCAVGRGSLVVGVGAVHEEFEDDNGYAEHVVFWLAAEACVFRFVDSNVPGIDAGFGVTQRS